MKITQAEWNDYVQKLSLLSNKASEDFKNFANKNGGWENIDRQVLAEAGWTIASKYSEGSSALAAEMYDAIARAEKVNVPPAELSADVEFGTVAKAINGALKHSSNDDFVSSTVGRAVKQAGADTMLKNATRDGAEFAWIPSGDTCAFCLVLASNGWRRASKKTTNGGHAEHIHTHCNCQFAIRFNNKSQIEGYDPEELQKIYYNAEGDNWKEKIKSLQKAYRNEENNPNFKIKGKPYQEYSEKEVIKMTRKANRVLSKHLDVPTKWSGNVTFSDEIEWYKDWNCDIVTSTQTSPFILLHEQVHARSISRSGDDPKSVYRKYRMEEESAVQLFTQEVSKKEGIILDKSKYDRNADALRKINKTFNLFDTDYDFSKELIKHLPNERQAWLLDIITQGTDMEKMNEFLDLWDEVVNYGRN